GPIPLMPLTVGSHQFALAVHVLPVLRRRLTIQETHEGTVRHEGDNPLVFITERLQAADPHQHHHQPDTGHRDSDAVGFCSHLEKRVEIHVYSSHCYGMSKVAHGTHVNPFCVP